MKKDSFIFLPEFLNDDGSLPYLFANRISRGRYLEKLQPFPLSSSVRGSLPLCKVLVDAS